MTALSLIAALLCAVRLDFGAPGAVELHGAEVRDGRLVLDAASSAYATAPAPDTASWGGIRLAARFRLTKLAPGQVPAMLPGCAALYVMSSGQPLAMYWAGGKRRAVEGAVKLQPGRWYQMTLDVRDGGLVSLWLDGTLIGRDISLGRLDPAPARLVIGRWQWRDEKGQHFAFMSGEVDWVEVGRPRGKSIPQTGLWLGKAVSWGDEILFGRLTTRQAIRDYLSSLARAGYRTVHWRLSSAVLREFAVRAPEEKRAAYVKRYFALIDDIYGRFDPIAEACRAAHDLGLEIFGWLTIFDEGAPPHVLYGGSTPFPWQSKFTRDHPELLVRDRRGQPQWGVLEYAYPQARRYKVSQIVYFAGKYDLDGIFISTRSHCPPAQDGDRFGFNAPVVEEFRRRFGADILREDFDREAWRRLRGEGLTRLLRELRGAMPPGKRICIGIPRGDHIGPPYGNMFLDWRTWVRDRLVDELLIGEVSGKGLYPHIKDYRGYVFDQEAGVGLRPLLEDIASVFGPECWRAGVKLWVAGRSHHPAFWRLAEAGRFAIRL